MGAMYLANGRNKCSVAVDLKQPPDKQALLRLCESAELFIHNVRPAAMQRAGLGYDDLRAINPQIVYMVLVRYGEHGPHANRPALNDIIQAASGVAGM